MDQISQNEKTTRSRRRTIQTRNTAVTKLPTGRKPARVRRGIGLKQADDLFVPKNIDFAVLLVVITLLCFGLVMLFSASMSDALADQGNTWHYVLRQVLFTLGGLAVMWLITRVDMKFLNNSVVMVVVYLFTTALLVLVLSPVGIEINGQQRWLPIFVVSDMTFQPSEIAKIAAVYCGASYFSWRRRKLRTTKPRKRSVMKRLGRDFFWDFIIPVGAVGIWCVLISMQSHMSAILIILLITFIVLLAAGISRRSWMVAVGFLTVIALSLVFIFMTFKGPILEYVASNDRLDHMIQRFDIFLESDNASSDDSYQADQALIAIGSGGWFGVGLGQGRQKNNYLPESHNDYIYSIVVEELGAVGGGLIILLFLLFFALGIRVAVRTKSLFNQVIATGFSSLIAIQAFLSIAVNLKVFIPTGISLPFFSYGGTSNAFFLLGIGLLLNVSKYGLNENKLL